MLQIQTTATLSTPQITVFNGMDYLVIPVIAMVEGVRFGANQQLPELGLAEDFGMLPQAWDASPVVLSHPYEEGSFVSARSADMLEKYGMGMIQKTERKGKKLYMEAWIDMSAGGKSPEIAAMIEQLQNAATVEVSVGMYVQVDPQAGTYEGTEYFGVWKNIVPDHLAILPPGTIGACSIEDGCGTNRVNMRFNRIGETTTMQNSECTCKKAVDSSIVLHDNGEDKDKIEEATPVNGEFEMPDTVTPAAPPTPTLAEVIPQLSAEEAFLVNESLALYAQKRNELISQLQVSKKCTLPETFLQSQSLEILTSLVALAAAPTPTYTGLTAPAPVTQTDTNMAPTPPKLFG